MVYVREGICDQTGTREVESQKRICGVTSGARCVVYYNDKRMLFSPIFYIYTHERTYGPFESYVEACSEMEYLQDPCNMFYVPGATYKMYWRDWRGKHFVN